MKIKFSVRLAYDKKNTIWCGIAMLLAVVMYMTVECSPWALAGFVALYCFIKCLVIELDERLPWLWTAILFAAGAFLTTRMIQYMLLEAGDYAKLSDSKLLTNVLCVLAVYLFTQFFTNNSGMSCMISHVALLFFAFINYFVYLFRGNEFTFSDLRSIGTGLSVAGNYQFALHDRGVYAIVASVLLVAFVRKCDVRFVRVWQMRLIAVLLLALTVILIVLRAYDIHTETWEQKGTYKNGYILNYVLSIRDSIVKTPDGYSRQAVEALEENYLADGDYYVADVENPTVIVIMNESFADLSVIGEMRTNLPLTPFYDSLKRNTLKGYALSSVFGAKTPNSEWEFLTGNTMAFLPEGAVVYQQYLSDTPDSIVSVLKDEGYTCVAMHPYYETGWSRNLVYPDIGFDEMNFIDDFDQTRLVREYISDQELYDKIIARYESRGVNEKLFVMGITMQNHGGYTKSYDNFPEGYYKTGRSYTDANQYFSLIHESDVALENLVTYFQNVEEPVEIVFFGDHQPSLTHKFYPILNGKGLTGLTEDELEKLYTVPYFIWTNYDTPPERANTSLNYLSVMTLQRAGIELPPYYRFLAELKEVVPQINARGYYSPANGCYLHVNEAAGEEEEWIRNYRILQYNSMFDSRRKSRVFFPRASE